MILNISWKNIWRNKLRSFIIMMALTLGIFAGLFLIAFTQGMTEQRIGSALDSEISHIQIHKPEYLENDDFNEFISNTNEIEELLNSDTLVKGFSRRILLSSMIKTTETGTGVTIQGIYPEEERKVTDIHTKIIEGNYFTDFKRKPIVIGQKLAEKLDLKQRSKVVLSLQDTSGIPISASFRVIGIYRTNNSAFDEMNVFILNDDMIEITGLSDESAHEIAVYLNNRNDISVVQQKLEANFSELKIRSWDEVSVMLAYLNDAMSQYLVIFMLIILFALFFGIVNTMLMAIMERRKEIGMLIAIGMSKLRIFLMITIESILLSVLGAVLGIIIGTLSILYFSKNGLDLSLWSKGFEAYGYDPIVYFELNFEFMAITILLVVLTGIIASIYPARKALKLNPSEALRIDN